MDANGVTIPGIVPEREPPIPGYINGRLILLDRATCRPLPVQGPSEPEYPVLHRIADEKKRFGKCYFIGGEAGHIKIGYSVDVPARLTAIQACSPIPLKVLAVIDGGEPREAAYHAQFREHRRHGEWFDRHPAILAEIGRITTTI